MPLLSLVRRVIPTVRNGRKLSLESLEDRRLLTSLNAQYVVELQTHSVAFGFDHLSVLITPQDPSLYHDNDSDDHADEDPLFVRRGDGSFALSLGAGPEPLVGGDLVARFNRPNDIELHTAAQRHTLSTPSGFADSRAWVNALISRSAGYGDNLDYSYFPEGIDEGFNSNSFVAGLLAATGTVVADPSTIFVDGDYPGFPTPVPTAAFGSAPAQRVDLVFVIDTTGSMSDDIAAVKTSATEIIDTIHANFLVDGDVDARIAVVDYRDFPVDPYGGSGDYPYNDVQVFTSSQSTANSGIQSLSLGYGGDFEESVYSGLMHSIDASSLGSWRGVGVSKMMVLMGDAPPHDPEPLTGYTMNDVIVAAANEDPVVVFPIAIGGYATSSFQGIADGTGGQLFTAANASQVVDAILEAIDVITNTPVAEAGGPYSGSVGAPVSFDASGSFDPNGEIVLYEWDWESDGTYDLATVDPFAEHTWMDEFSGRIRVRVTDDDGQSSFDWADVSVISAGAPLDVLIGMVDELRLDGALNDGNANALTVKLENAQKSVTKGNTAAAVNKIEAFVNEVNALRSARKLNDDQADELIAIAWEAIALLEDPFGGEL